VDETGAEGRTRERVGGCNLFRRRDDVHSTTKGQGNSYGQGMHIEQGLYSTECPKPIGLCVRERFVDHMEFGPQPTRTITLGGVRETEPSGTDLLPTSNSHGNPLLNFGSPSPPNMGGFYDPKKVSATLHTTLFFN